MSLQVQQYLHRHGLEKLCSELKINCTRHHKYPNLVLLKYGHIGDFSNPIVQECRGLILDEANAWKVVAYPFKKFFNHTEPNASSIDWSTAKVYEKLDGSLMTLYPYKGEWHVASSGLPDASGEVVSGLTFESLFWTTFHKQGLPLPPKTYLDDTGSWPVCFMFELVGPQNKIVVRYNESKLYLIGARSLASLEELDTASFSNLYETCPTYPITDLDSAIEAVKNMNPIANEGFVVADATFKRVKIKSPKYVFMHQFRGLTSDAKILDVIRNGEKSEVSTVLPETTVELEKMETRYQTLCDKIDAEYNDTIKSFYQEMTQMGVMEADQRFKKKVWATVVNRADRISKPFLFEKFSNRELTARAFLDRLSSAEIMTMMKQVENVIVSS